MRKHHRHFRARGPQQLQMTSMMDILTVLLLFLLKSFVVDPEVVTPASGLQLPKSSSENSPQESIVIAIVGDRISIGDSVVASLDDSGDQSLMIDSLASALLDARLQQEHLQEIRGATESAPPKVTIQGDREMPFETLQRVMYTCNQTGFDDIALAVLRAS